MVFQQTWAWTDTSDIDFGRVYDSSILAVFVISNRVRLNYGLTVFHKRTSSASDKSFFPVFFSCSCRKEAELWTAMLSPY